MKSLLIAGLVLCGLVGFSSVFYWIGPMASAWILTGAMP